MEHTQTEIVFSKSQGFVCRNDIYEPACDWCEEDHIKLYSCANCRYSNYCSKDCQRNAWKSIHKHICSIYVTFNPYTEVDKLLDRKDVKDALNVYSRYSPRLVEHNNNLFVMYFHLICVNTFGNYKRSGVYTVLKLGSIEYMKDKIKYHKVPNISVDRLQDIFHIKISFYYREEIHPFPMGRYYFLDLVEKVAYVPEVNNSTAIRNKEYILNRCQIYGNVAIYENSHDIVTEIDSHLKEPFVCIDTELDKK